MLPCSTLLGGKSGFRASPASAVRGGTSHAGSPNDLISLFSEIVSLARVASIATNGTDEAPRRGITTALTNRVAPRIIVADYGVSSSPFRVVSTGVAESLTRSAPSAASITRITRITRIAGHGGLHPTALVVSRITHRYNTTVTGYGSRVGIAVF